MRIDLRQAYNPYFHLPFILWVIWGGIALLQYDAYTLFFFFNSSHTPLLDNIMFFTTYLGDGLFTALLLLVLLGLSSLRNWWYFFTALLTNALPNIFIQFVKTGVNAPRPLKFFNNAEWIHILPDWPRYMERSFPSGHTTSAFCLFCFLSLLVPAKYRPIGFIFFLLAIMVAYSRMYLAAHFFADVYAGSIIATLFTTVIFAVLNNYRQQLQNKSAG